jgi:hypothetical protein
VGVPEHEIGVPSSLAAGWGGSGRGKGGERAEKLGSEAGICN